MILVIAVVAVVIVGISAAVIYGHSDNDTPSIDPEQTTYTYSIGYDGNGAIGHLVLLWHPAHPNHT